MDPQVLLNIVFLSRLSSPTPLPFVGANGSFMAFVSRGSALHALSFLLAAYLAYFRSSGLFVSVFRHAGEFL